MISKRVGKLIELAARGVGTEARGFCLQKLGWPKDIRFIGPHGLRHTHPVGPSQSGGRNRDGKPIKINFATLREDWHAQVLIEFARH
jgi:hypothetical protein